MKQYYGINDFLSKHQVKQGRTLVVGSKVYGNKLDRRTVYPDAIGVDLFEGDGVDITHDLETPLPDDMGMFDHVDCCSVLEHVKRPWRLCENVEAVMTDGATILLQVPFVWRVHDYPGDYWRFTTESFEILFPSIKWIRTGYLMDTLFKHGTLSLDKGGKKYLQRSEAIGFGVKCTSS